MPYLYDCSICQNRCDGRSRGVKAKAARFDVLSKLKLNAAPL